MSPGDANQNFAKVCDIGLYLVQLPPHFDRVSEKNNGWIKCYEAKSVIFSHFRAFWGFFSHKRAPGDATRIIFKNQRMLHFLPYKVVTPCKISEKYNGYSLRILGTDARTDGRTDGRTRVNSKVPIPTKVGGPTSRKLSGPPICTVKISGKKSILVYIFTTLTLKRLGGTLCD